MYNLWPGTSQVKPDTSNMRPASMLWHQCWLLLIFCRFLRVKLLFHSVARVIKPCNAYFENVHQGYALCRSRLMIIKFDVCVIFDGTCLKSRDKQWTSNLTTDSVIYYRVCVVFSYGNVVKRTSRKNFRVKYMHDTDLLRIILYDGVFKWEVYRVSPYPSKLSSQKFWIRSKYPVAGLF